jgi:hypothetical protein
MSNALNVVLAVTALASGLGCTRHSGGQSFDFNDEAERVQRLTISAGAQTMERHPVARTPMALCQDWRVAAAIPWPGYAKQVTHSLEPSYSCEAISAARTACARRLAGDLPHLELAAEPTRAGLQVRISLEMRPD